MTRLLTLAAILTVVVCGAVLAFADPIDPVPWTAAGFIAAGVALAVREVP